MKAIKIVRFKNLLEESYDDIKLGVLLDNENILCFCCGSYFEKEDYEIIEEYSENKWLIDIINKQIEC